jgi:hypothetical protein
MPRVVRVTGMKHFAEPQVIWWAILLAREPLWAMRTLPIHSQFGMACRGPALASGSTFPACGAAHGRLSQTIQLAVQDHGTGVTCHKYDVDERWSSSTCLVSWVFLRYLLLTWLTHLPPQNIPLFSRVQYALWLLLNIIAPLRTLANWIQNLILKTRLVIITAMDGHCQRTLGNM